MGLAIVVGPVDDPEARDARVAEIAAMNEVLSSVGLGPHREPPSGPQASPVVAAGLSYGDLHLLRRISALVRQDRDVVPRAGRLTPIDDERIRDAASDLDSHLLCHADHEGLYVPIDFGAPIFDDRLPGAILGSTHGLARELQAIAPNLGLELPIGADALRALAEGAAGGHPFARERAAWAALFTATQASLASGAVIRFC